ncbi:MAG: hypothetical protein EA370_02445 [Wenzhouxiangella sp.]|nr:MAG: hypothetical protein EA370_02445 [Wenzhouxiangella sp.]
MTHQHKGITVQDNQPVSVGNWMLTILIMAIPLVNLIMLLVWAFSSGTPESKSNWAKATLIWMLILIVVSVLFGIVGGLGMAML